jgi:hypothetical protein
MRNRPNNNGNTPRLTKGLLGSWNFEIWWESQLDASQITVDWVFHKGVSNKQAHIVDARAEVECATIVAEFLTTRTTINQPASQPASNQHG